MENLILVKLGGSLITDKSKPYTARTETIERLSREIHSARKEGGFNLILGHGGGSFPHVSAEKYQTQKGFINKESPKGVAVVQNDAAKLNRIVVDELLDAGEKAMSIQPSASCIAENGRIREWFTKPVEMMLAEKMLPVVYGDVSLDVRQGCCILSTEEVLRFLAGKLGATRIIMAGKVDGVMAGGNVIPEITHDNLEEVKQHIQGSDGIDVTGGMVHKINQALEMTSAGAQVEIINGDKPDILKRALLGEDSLGTKITQA